MNACLNVLHLYRTSPNNMLRRCCFCDKWQVNINNSYDPATMWRDISDDRVDKLIEGWKQSNKVL